MCTKRIRFVKALTSLFIIWLLIVCVCIPVTADKKHGNNIKKEDKTHSITFPEQVMLGGFPFGTKIKSDGVIVVDVKSVEGVDKVLSPALDAGIKKGDIIKKVNGKSVSDSSDVSEIIRNSDGLTVNIEILRDGKTLNFSVTPVLSRDGKSYKSGLFIRDGAAGIGTVTFVIPKTKFFGGLGHGITDAETGKVIPIKSGEVSGVSLLGIVKGERGRAGELRGRLEEEVTGKLLINSESGVFGVFDEIKDDLPLVPVCRKTDVREGKCQVVTTVEEGKQITADAVIEKIIDPHANVKNFIIKIVDPELLDKTGGIVQGMSGSPIIQDGKLIGAVTHVLLDDSARGYGIFIENMLDQN